MKARLNGAASEINALTKLSSSPRDERVERHLDSEIRNIKDSLIKMGGMVERAIDKAILSLKKRDPEMAAEVVEQDQIVNRLEIEIESQCRTNIGEEVIYMVEAKTIKHHFEDFHVRR